MPPKSQQAAAESRAPLLPALFLLAAPIAWPFFEWYAIQGYGHGAAGYDWTVESFSDLGVDYRQVHPLKHHNVESHRHGTSNFNFIQAGACFGIAQLLMLYVTRSRVTQQTALLRTLRFVLTLFYVGGMVLFAQIHGGPREKFWKIIGWHWNGFAMAAIAGNLNSILSAARTQIHSYEGNIIYRAVSLMLGGAGLYSFNQWLMLGEWNYQTKLGLWQRGAIYPVLLWDLVTGLALVYSATMSGGEKSKKQ